MFDAKSVEADVWGFTVPSVLRAYSVGVNGPRCPKGS